MIAVNINRSWKRGLSPEEILEVGAGQWSGVSDDALEEHAALGEKIVFVARNVMVGGATITGATRGDDGKVTFTLKADEPFDEAVRGVPFPDPWLRGQLRAVRYVQPAAIEAALASAHPAQGVTPKPREVSLDGFRLLIDPVTRVATLVVPAGRDVIISARRSR